MRSSPRPTRWAAAWCPCDDNASAQIQLVSSARCSRSFLRSPGERFRSLPYNAAQREPRGVLTPSAQSSGLDLKRPFSPHPILFRKGWDLLLWMGRGCCPSPSLDALSRREMPFAAYPRRRGHFALVKLRLLLLGTLCFFFVPASVHVQVMYTLARVRVCANSPWCVV